jgi:hypothetical protein
LLVQFAALEVLTSNEIVEFVAVLGHQISPLFFCEDAVGVELLLK